VTKLRASDGKVLGTFPAVSWPDDITFDGTNIWVVNELAGSVTKLATDGTLLGTFPIPDDGGDLHGIVFDGTAIWVGDSNNDRVVKLRASDGSLLGKRTVGKVPWGLA